MALGSENRPAPEPSSPTASNNRPASSKICTFPNTASTTYTWPAVSTATPKMQQDLDTVKWDMLNEWAQTKRAPRHASWMHEKELAPTKAG